MNSRPIDSDDHSLPSTSRVSASSRFSRPPASLYASSSHDYGNNDNYRATSPASSRASSVASAKGGINGRGSAYEDDNDDEGLLLGLSSRSARRSAAKRSASNSSAPLAAVSSSRKDNNFKQGDYRLEISRSNSSGTSSLSNSGKDRPWRTSASASSAIASVNNDVAEGKEEEEDAHSLGNENDGDDDALNESYDVEVTSDRWSQYETRDLAEESRRATSNAVVDMATRIADEQQQQYEVEPPSIFKPTIVEPPPPTMMGGSAGAGLYRADPDNLEGLEALHDRGSADALESNGNSLPGPPSSGVFRGAGNIHAGVNSNSRSTTDYVKSRLSALVTHRNSTLSDSNPPRGGYERSASSSSSAQSDHDKVRNEALKMLQIADSCLADSPRSSRPNSPVSSSSPTTGLFRTKGGGLAMRELHDDEARGISKQRQVKGEETKEERRNTISSIAGLDKFRSKERGSPSRAFDGTFTIGSRDEEDTALKNGNPASSDENATSSSWSSRYSVERQLMAITGGLDSTRMLAKMDVLHSSREKTKSARGMYRASGHAMDGSHEDYDDYTRSSSTTGAMMGGVIWTWLRGTLWSDDLELNHDGTTQSLVRREKAMRRRRRFRWVTAFLLSLAVAVGILSHMGRTKVATSVTSTDDDVDFYVLADEPFDFSDTEQLTRELEALQTTRAEFVIHLGNANGDEQSRCQEYGFERAAAVLRESPVPVLVIPGDQDWAACGSRKKAERALRWWDVNLGRFAERWRDRNPLKGIDYDDDVVGNFAFLHKDVLFVAVSIVDAETEPEEVTRRLELNASWTKGKLAEYRRDEYRAVVIFGHAPPSERQGGYFDPVIVAVKDLGKPVLYLHASTSNNGGFERYAPYEEAENFGAVQLERRGREAPMRVVVMGDGKDGDDTFVIERRDPTLERIEK